VVGVASRGACPQRQCKNAVFALAMPHYGQPATVVGSA
jgi:hypothetical protein